MEWPELAKLAPDAFPKDVIARAAELQQEIGSIGAYSHSQGVPFIRENVAKFIERESKCVSEDSSSTHSCLERQAVMDIRPILGIFF
jgi:hypothetical protein